MREPMQTAIDHAKRQKAVWRIELCIFDEGFAKEIKHRAVDDDISYSDMLLTGLRMYLAQGKKPEEKDPRLP